MDEDTIKFLSELEAKHGGTIEWRTYATWYGCDDGTIREYGVFLYKIKDTFYFEDFERFPMILGYKLKPKKNAPKYEKYERSFRAEHVVRVSSVTKSRASDCAQGLISAAAVTDAGWFSKIFKQLVTKVEMETGTTFFFELMDPKRFVREIDKNNNLPVEDQK